MKPACKDLSGIPWTALADAVLCNEEIVRGLWNLVNQYVGCRICRGVHYVLPTYNP